MSTNVTSTCRDINELKPNAKSACQILFQECFKAGINDIFITETYRSQERQNYLYQQGRTRKYDSLGNKLNVVTWTLNSNHTPRLAWDIAVAPPKNLYDTPTLQKVGAIAKKLGIEWGGYWKSPNYDAPHFQVSANWKAPNNYKLEGTVGVPTSSKERITFKPNGGVSNTSTDYSKKIGTRIEKNAKAFRIQTDAYSNKQSADNGKVILVKDGYLSYAEVFGNDKTGYRVQSGKYKTEQDARNASIKMLDAKLIGYASIIGNLE